MKYTFRQAGFAKSLLQSLGAQWSLCRVLEDHGIARKQGRHNRVNRGQVWKIPGCDYEYHTQGLTFYVTRKSVFRGGLQVCQGRVRNLDHVSRPFFKASDFAGCL